MDLLKYYSLLIPAMGFFFVYKNECNRFSVSPDSQGWLHSPAGSQSYRPNLYWLFARFFANQKQIDSFFSTHYKLNTWLNSPEFLLTICRAQYIIYAISFLFLLFVLIHREYFNAKAVILISAFQFCGINYYSNSQPLSQNFTDLLKFSTAVLFFLYFSKVFSARKFDKRLLIQIFAICNSALIAIVLLRYSNLPDERFGIMSETLSISLIFLTLATFLMYIKDYRLHYLLIMSFIIGLATNLRLSLLFLPFLLIIVHFKRFRTKRYVPLARRFIIGLLPFIIVSILIPKFDEHNRSSLSAYGFVPYAYSIYIENRDIDFGLSTMEKSILNIADNTCEKLENEYAAEITQFKHVSQIAGMYLYKCLIPAYSQVTQDQNAKADINATFADISAKIILKEPVRYLKILSDNTLQSFGLTFNEKQKIWNPASKFHRNPISFLLFCNLVGFIFLLSRNKSIAFIFLSIDFVTILISALANGPVARYGNLVDPLIGFTIALLLVEFENIQISGKKIDRYR